MQISNDIFYVGVNDREIDLFEGQYTVSNGMAYNSYVLKDEKTAVMDSVDARFADAWLENIRALLGDRAPDYLIVQHMEPDHSGSIARFMDAYPTATVVSTEKAFVMMKQYFGKGYEEQKIAVGEGDTLQLGKHTLTFLTAPMVHWPEVMVSYDACDKVLFSADAFGKFGALDTEEDWACEARRYYFGIVGKYGAQTQKLLAKAKNVDIQTICPLHGPVLTENLDYYLGLYDTWSSYRPEEKGILIAYTSVYGNTKAAVLRLADALEKKGVSKVVLTDLARSDMAEAVEDAFRYDRLILATTTYNGDIFPFMREFIHNLTERNYQNRKLGIVENGSWSPLAAKVIRKMLENSKNLTFAEATVTLLGGWSEKNEAELDALAEEMSHSAHG